MGRISQTQLKNALKEHDIYFNFENNLKRHWSVLLLKHGVKKSKEFNKSLTIEFKQNDKERILRIAKANKLTVSSTGFINRLNFDDYDNAR